MGSSRLNKFGLFSLLIAVVVMGSSCSYYNRVMARMNLVDGAAAYNERKFDEAMEKFRRAVSYDPDGNTLESKTAQLFLARTLHSLFAGNRKKKENAERAIEEYQKALPGFVREVAENKAAVDANPNDPKLRSTLEKNSAITGSIVSAIGSLYENLQQEDKWEAWQQKTADNAELPASVRANALVGMAAKDYTCASEITDNEAVKKTVTKDGEQAFEFVKPEDEADFAKLKKCVQEGSTDVDKAIALSPDSDSAWSYKASLLVQNMRIAEMEGNSEQQAKLKKESETAKAKFEELAKIRREKEEEEARQKAKEVGGEVKGSDKSDGSGTEEKK
ncbi:MAG: hypothetical protein KDB79_04220 [Acidobacteria bacterium]|nr:hypothetical protein [Acidobacteriota bacterium]